MTKSKRSTTSPKVADPIETNAAQMPSLFAHTNGEAAAIAALRARLLGMVGDAGTPTARIHAVIPRADWDEVIAACTDCGQAHRHHVGHDEDRPVTRRVRCDSGRTTTYVLDLDAAR
ncbi:hypothetical protein ACI78Q_06010 [Geodermatophilus sp. SYSU D00705]